jgi:hypothetical protein
MKRLFFILVLASSSFSVTGFTWYWNINLAGDTATVTKWKSNNDSVLNWSNRIGDTTNTKPNFSQVYRNHDSTFTFIIIDTVKGYPYLDSALIQYLFFRNSTGTACWKIRPEFTTNNRILEFENSSSTTTGGWEFRATDAGLAAAILTIQVNGRIGIKDTTPERELDVNGTIKTKHIQFGDSSTSKCSTYVDTTFPDTLFDGTTYRAATTDARIVQIGKLVSLCQTGLTGTITTTTDTHLKGIPSKFFPAVSTNVPVVISNNSVAEMGLLRFSGGDVLIHTLAGAQLTAGTGGIGTATVIHWIK